MQLDNGHEKDDRHNGQKEHHMHGAILIALTELASLFVILDEWGGHGLVPTTRTCNSPHCREAQRPGAREREQQGNDGYYAFKQRCSRTR